MLCSFSLSITLFPNITYLFITAIIINSQNENISFSFSEVYNYGLEVVEGGRQQRFGNGVSNQRGGRRETGEEGDEARTVNFFLNDLFLC